MPECYSNYRVRVSGRVRQMVALPEYKILCPLRSVAKFEHIVVNVVKHLHAIAPYRMVLSSIYPGFICIA